jgi:hypothetical protein
MADERKRAGAGLHFIGGIDIVLQQHRDSMERPEHLAVTAQLVHVFRYLQRVWVEFDHRVDSFVTLVEGSNAGDVFLRQRY